MNTRKFNIRQVDPATERSIVIRLLEENMPEAATEGRFDWAYLDNSDGVASVWLAETTHGEAVGTSAAFPRQFRIDGSTVKGLVLSDFAIDQRFRTLGPAIALLRATLAPVDDGSFEFALDHPSDSMAAVYSRLGGTKLGQQKRYVRLLKTSGAARRRWGKGLGAAIAGSLGDFAIRTSDRLRRIPGDLTVDIHSGAFGEEFGKLGRVLTERGQVFGERSPDYLNWRYRSGIRFAYSTVTVRSERELLAYAVLQDSGSTSLTITEFVSPADAAVEDALLHGLLDVCHRNNVESLQASCTDGNAWCTILKRLGFIEREPSTGPIVYSPKNAKWTELLTDRNQWWLTDGDRDG